MENKSLMSRSDLLSYISNLENEIASMKITVKSSGLIFNYDHSCLYEDISEQVDV
jgi:hypothetical protein